MGRVTLVATTVATTLVPYLKSSQVIAIYMTIGYAYITYTGTRSLKKMSCRELTRVIKYQDSSASNHYSDVIISGMVSQITCVRIVYSTVCSGEDRRKHQSSASLAFVGGIHRWPANSPHKGPVARKMFPFDDVIMLAAGRHVPQSHDHVTSL